MARLQRNDLAREFSDVVQQEIKNHNDSLLATNVLLNEFKKQMVQLTAVHEFQEQQSAAKFLDLGSYLVMIEESLQNSIKDLQRQINDKEAETKANLISMHKSFDERETYYMTVEGFQKFKEQIDAWSANIQRSFTLQQDMMRQHTTKIIEETKSGIDFVRSALEKKILEEAQARKDQDKTIDRFAIGFDGLQVEIERLKKRNFVVEKNIEKLYILIERLKVGT